MTEDDPMRVPIVHRGRRRCVPVVLRTAGPLSVDGRPVGHAVAGIVVEMTLPGGHQPTDRFIEEMAEDLGPAEEEDHG